MKLDPILTGYVVYLALSIAMTVWVARVLSRNGLVFLKDKLGESLAPAVNQLLQVGFYLINIGFIALWLTAGDHASSTRAVFESTVTKFGVVALILGGMHMLNVLILNGFRDKHGQDKHRRDQRPHAVG